MPLTTEYSDDGRIIKVCLTSTVDGLLLCHQRTPSGPEGKTPAPL